ncbi:MAG: T9SS type A sorting domain-containing protein, partial [Chlorobi bacterium]|nr:T9SS type A sorting domain-containing protein [Chlorobiota bacterium]
IDRSGGVYLSGNTSITKLNFTNGNLYTGSYTLTIDPSQLSGEADGSYIVGTVKTTSQDLTTSATVFSNLGLTFPSTFSTGNSVTLIRTTGSGAAVTVSGNSGFDRVYQLDGTMTYTGFVTCDWFGSESSGRNLSKVAIHEFVSATSEWITRGPDAAATGSYSATSNVNTDVSSVSQIKYTITDDANPLPVELTSFTASVDDRTVTLNWETATEVDNYGFEIERNLVQENKEANWETLGFVQGSGNSNSPKEYSYVDESVFFGNYQYRLKQVDTDGKFEYFDVVEVQVGEVPTEYSLRQNYPNPFNPSTVIEFGLPETANVTLSVYNLLGEKVATLFSGNMEAGMHKVDFNANNLSSGIYIYSLEGQSVRITKKMMLMK